METKSVETKREWTRRDFMRLSIMSATTIIAAACVAPPPPGVQNNGGTGASAEPVTLEFWGTADPATMQPDIDTWNGAHPDTQVTYLFTPNVSSVGTNPKFLAATLGGNPPDVIWHDGSNFVSSASLNAFEELDDLAARDGITSDLYWDAFWPKVIWNAHLYGLPHNTDARALYWNKSYLEEAGISAPPATLPELDAMTETLTKGTRDSGYERIGFIPWNGNWFLVAWGWAFGAQVFDPASNKALLNAPEMVAALEWEMTYATKYGVEDLTAFTKAIAGETTDPFVTGNVAMQAHGNWVISSLARYAPDLQYGISPVPVPEGKDPITWSGGFVMGIPRGVRNIDASWEFLKWKCGEEGQLDFCVRTNTLPTHKVASDKFAEAQPDQKIFIDLMPATKIEPVIPEWEVAWDAHLQAEQEALYGYKTAQQALDDANARVQEAIDRRLQES